MYESPRIRRLRNDLAALERLKGESSVLRYTGRGEPVQHYLIEFRGNSLARERGKVTVRERHEVEIKLGASYPPIYHPNISEIGMVCLGGYGTHWVPSLNLDELCGMLWDMARYHNYDIRSPYNREAALWVANQTTFRFPLDDRPLRDLRAALGRVDPEPAAADARPEPDRAQAQAQAAPPAANGRPRDVDRYREFARKLAAGLRAGSASASGDAVETDGLILLDLEVELTPLPPRSGPNEEIVFIE
jgi:hypothetical protein